MEFVNGKAPRVPNAARENPQAVVDIALKVWERRKQTAADSGKKLQQTPFSILTEDGQTAWLVRPRVTGLEFYTKAAFGVEFKQPVAPVETRIVGIEQTAAAPAKPRKPRKPRAKR